MFSEFQEWMVFRRAISGEYNETKSRSRLLCDFYYICNNLQFKNKLKRL